MDAIFLFITYHRTWLTQIWLTSLPRSELLSQPRSSLIVPPINQNVLVSFLQFFSIFYQLNTFNTILINNSLQASLATTIQCRPMQQSTQWTVSKLAWNDSRSSLNVQKRTVPVVRLRITEKILLPSKTRTTPYLHLNNYWNKLNEILFTYLLMRFLFWKSSNTCTQKHTT